MDSHTSLLETMLTNVIGAHAEGIEAGASMIEKRIFPALRVLETEYIKAEADRAGAIPTSLGLAIINVLKYLPRP